MMELSAKLAIYFFIIASELDFLRSRPAMFLQGKSRKERQVVQPTWLTRPDFIFIDPNVRVTDENLKETAAIRESIQSAVNSGTFAVDVSQPNTPIPVVESSESAQRPQPFSHFEFPKLFDISQWNFQIFSIEQQNAFTGEMRRLWQEFINNSRKWMNFDQ